MDGSFSKIQISDTDHPYFKYFWEIYNENFPLVEKRVIIQQKQIFPHPAYHLLGFLSNQKLKAFIAYWTFEEFNFIEHLAIDKTAQDKGLGSEILTYFLKRNTKPVILEIEHPEDEQTNKRLSFYQKLGFVKNQFNHFQPPFHDGNLPLNLLILSYRKEISKELYDKFAEIQKNTIMKHTDFRQ
jgi:GNAT superfamily N-acetyltransferase